VSAEKPHRLAPIICLADDLKVLLAIDERAHAFSCQTKTRN